MDNNEGEQNANLVRTIEIQELRPQEIENNQIRWTWKLND